MTNKECMIGGAIGTIASAGGTITQTNETLQTISLIITILGAVVSMIIIPVLNWYSKAKADGKITKDEIEEGTQTIIDGAQGVKEAIQGAKENKPSKSKEDK